MTTPDNPMNPHIDESTETLSVRLPELCDAPIGYLVTFMVGPVDVTFQVIGHDRNETVLKRTRKQKREKK